ncbi:MAG: UDP-3-O-(3-hydroxymyristoyl)glucosamine N-acyltransferase [Spirochaetia bacterium]|nr:UDP-3-O-(3-hydroxymyristoyl)glucosamine N-acyltransferase [Spirochaetia bacterium]
MNRHIKTNIQLNELAKILQCEFKGNPETLIEHIGDFNNLDQNNLSFQNNCIYYVKSEKLLLSQLNINPNSIILGDKNVSVHFSHAIMTGDNPRLDFIKLLEYFNLNISNLVNQGIFIHPTAKIGNNTTIAPGVYIGEGVIIEENCILYANAVIEPFTKISKNSTIHSGVFIGRHSIIGSHCIVYPNAVIGADGFGYIDENGRRYKIPQIGNVVLGDFVEVGACTTIDRSTIESTVIGDYTKIDNQVQIAHNCIIGKNVYIAGKASLAGSVKVRDNAILAGGCGIRDHVNIAEGSIILAFTGIEEDTLPHHTYFGIPGRKVREMHRINSALTYLPDLVKASKVKMNK